MNEKSRNRDESNRMNRNEESGRSSGESWQGSTGNVSDEGRSQSDSGRGIEPNRSSSDEIRGSERGRSENGRGSIGSDRNPRR